MAPTLCTVHDEVHLRLEERVYRTLEALIALDPASAVRHFREFSEGLALHMAIEDELVIPAWRPHAPVDGPGRADHLEGDHVVLVRLMGEIQGFLGEPVDLRTILKRLPSVYRLLGVMEHHTMREERVYRFLEGSLPSDACEHLTARLAALVDRLADG